MVRSTRGVEGGVVRSADGVVTVTLGAAAADGVVTVTLGAAAADGVCASLGADVADPLTADCGLPVRRSR